MNQGISQHQLVIYATGTPAVGVCKIEVRPQGASFYVPIGTIDLTQNGTGTMIFCALLDNIRLSFPGGISAGMSIGATVYSTGLFFTVGDDYLSETDRRRVVSTMITLPGGWNGSGTASMETPNNRGVTQHQFSIAGGTGMVELQGRPQGGTQFVSIDVQTKQIDSSGMMVIFAGMFDAFRLVPQGVVTGTIQAQISSVGELLFFNNVAQGTYGDATHVPVITVNGGGQITSITVVPINVNAALGYTAANDALVVHLAGTETITGIKTFGANTATNSQIVLNGAAGNSRNFWFDTAGVSRWAILADSTAESGSNAGSNLDIARMSDAGTLIDYPFSINRATGTITTTGQYSNAPSALGTVAGNSFVPWVTTQNVGVNTDNIVLLHYRNVNGTSWNDVVYQIYRQVDSTKQGFIQFGEGSGGSGVAFGSGANIRATMDTNGQWGFITSGSLATITLNDTGVNGANLRFVGNGGTTPNKTIRVVGGVLQFVNHAYNAVIASLSDTGTYTVSGNLNAQGAALVSSSTETDLFLGFGGSINSGMYIACSSVGLTVNRLSGGTFAGQNVVFQNANNNTQFGGVIYPASDNTNSCGTGSNRWSVIYAATGTINTSDARDKTSVTPLTVNEIAASKDLMQYIGTFQYLDAIQAKADGARIHIGMTVQQAMTVMQNHGLDPTQYGFICYDAWPQSTIITQAAIYDDQGNIVTPEVTVTTPAGDKYGFRTDELLFFLARGLDARLSAIEAKVP